MKNLFGRRKKDRDLFGRRKNPKNLLGGKEAPNIPIFNNDPYTEEGTRQARKKQQQFINDNVSPPLPVKPGNTGLGNSLMALLIYGAIPSSFWHLVTPFVKPILDAAQEELLNFYDGLDIPGLPEVDPYDLVPSEFPKVPTPSQRDIYIGQGIGKTVDSNKHLCWMQRRRYVDHRQQYEAIAVCNGTHPRIKYMGSSPFEQKDYYSYWAYDRFQKKWEIRLCTVNVGDIGDWYGFYLNWEWGGEPPDRSDLTAGRYMITWATWATYFKFFGVPDAGSWDGFSVSECEIPCELGSHKDGSLPAPAGPDNPYGPEGCLREEGERVWFEGPFTGTFIFRVWRRDAIPQGGGNYTLSDYYVPFNGNMGPETGTFYIFPIWRKEHASRNRLGVGYTIAQNFVMSNANFNSVMNLWNGAAYSGLYYYGLDLVDMNNQVISSVYATWDGVVAAGTGDR